MKLAEQAGFDLGNGQSYKVENFAELIVRECAGVELYWLGEQDRKSVTEKIKQHFGVE
jgi:hypothetical protein